MATKGKPTSAKKNRSSSEAGIIGGTIHSLHKDLTTDSPDVQDKSRTIQSKASVNDGSTRSGVAVGDKEGKKDKGSLS